MLETSAIEIVDDTTSIFDSKEWIGCGKTYPASNTPSYILTARAALLAIPPSFLPYLPNENLSVLALLQAPLPLQPSVLVQEHAEKCFSMLEPNEDVTCLLTRKIPPGDWIHKLDKALGQAWFDGKISLVDFRYGKESRLPLWTIAYWKEMSIILKKRKIWQSAHQWLSQTSQNRRTPCLAESDSALERMGEMRWGATLRGVARGLGIETLAPLLSEQWLDDDIINMAMNHLNTRTHLHRNISKTTIIAPLQFSANLISADRYPQAQAVALPYMHHYTEIFKSGQRTILYFPAHVNNNHWIALCVDFDQKTLRYGQSVQTWLKKQFGSSFQDEGDTLEHGVQKDQFSCGICVVNAIAHCVFGDELFTHAKRFALRIALFAELVDSQVIGVMIRTENCRSDSEAIVMDPDKTPETEPPISSPSSSTPDLYSDVMDTSADKAMAESAQHPPSSVPHISTTKKRRTSSPKIIPSFQNASTQLISKRLKYAASDDKQLGVVGISRSAKAGQKLKSAMRDGSLKINETRKENYEYTCQLHDQHVKFSYGDQGWQVRHSKCGKWHMQKVPYDTTRFIEHIKKCNAKGRVSMISDWMKKGENTKTPATKMTKKPEPKNSQPSFLPCLGITSDAAPKLPNYLIRTPVHGGGARRPHIVAFEVYGITYKDLDQDQKEYVDTLLRHEQTWTNDRALGRVYATDCKKTVVQPVDGPQRCSSCTAVLISKSFKTALSKPIPSAGNYAFLNKKYRNETLGKIYAKSRGLQALVEEKVWTLRNSLCIRYAIGVLEGKYKDNTVFTGLVEATVLAQERSERGVGLQNFEYTPCFEEFAHMCAITSPEAYRLLSKAIQLPTVRNLQLKRSRTPRFPIGICERTFELAEEYTKKLHYNGPLGLSCDDTKLHPAFRTYWDPIKKCHLLVGGVDEPMVVADPDELQAILRAARDKKATKIHLWCLQIPLPNMAPIIVAAKAIPNNLSASQLAPLSLKLITGLLERNLTVVSYSCDGTEVKRVVQDTLTHAAPYITTYVLPHPCTDQPEIVLKLPTFNGHPVVMIQDSKHALKTARNNLFTGARILSLGNHVRSYCNYGAINFCDNQS
ncbi:hypothetical protein BJ138DRAFT_1016289 [Hygrophoropsis aurantiaca]|uniref:Uncharacterized protein n=1 Tax=Hygrophoropsis aurantiaca TaxID=72124 RepID=A0ACB7ZYS2_9AGAM|nr:hypothetical protein BJ138DRAFT_1016289 [Hygrophoropsis aurantiaca]